MAPVANKVYLKWISPLVNFAIWLGAVLEFYALGIAFIVLVFAYILALGYICFLALEPILSTFPILF